MNFEQFRAEVSEFCRLYCRDYFASFKCEYDDTGLDDDFEATIKIECAVNRKYELTLIPSPDADGEIVISLVDPNYLSADAGGLYLWLWAETMRQEDQLMHKAGLMRMGDGELRAQYFVEDGRHVYLEIEEWKQARKDAAAMLSKIG